MIYRPVIENSIDYWMKTSQMRKTCFHLYQSCIETIGIGSFFAPRQFKNKPLKWQMKPTQPLTNPQYNCRCGWIGRKMKLR